jgi:hypothetical protein
MFIYVQIKELDNSPNSLLDNIHQMFSCKIQELFPVVKISYWEVQIWMKNQT